VSGSKTTVIRLTLPSLQAMALAHFVKRVDFNTVTRFASVAVACEDGKAEADLVWLALIELRSALAEAGAASADLRTSDPAAIGPCQIAAAALPSAKPNERSRFFAENGSLKEPSPARSCERGSQRPHVLRSTGSLASAEDDGGEFNPPSPQPRP
jgi:hypothetical protein